MPRVKIEVESGDWGNAFSGNIQRLLEDVTNQLSRHFTDLPEIRIRVQSRPNKPGPRTLYRDAPDEDIVIWLTTRDRFWSQFSYQFSHEL